MNYKVHETAIVEEGAEIGINTKIWHWTNISKRVKNIVKILI